MTNSETKSKTLQKQFFNILKNFTGQDDILTIPRAFVDFTGNRDAALLLSQCLFRQGQKKPGEYFWKSYKQWEEEITLKEHEVRRIAKSFKEKGWIETKVKKISGDPILHYRIIPDKLHHDLSAFLENRLLTNLSKEGYKSELRKVTNPQEGTCEIGTNHVSETTDTETTDRDNRKEEERAALSDSLRSGRPSVDLSSLSSSFPDSSFKRKNKDKEGRQPKAFDSSLESSSLQEEDNPDNSTNVSKAPIAGGGSGPVPRTRQKPVKAPSQAQLAYALGLAAEYDIEVPGNIHDDVVTCSVFISKIKSGELVMISDGKGNKYSLSAIKKEYGCTDLMAGSYARQKTRDLIEEAEQAEYVEYEVVEPTEEEKEELLKREEEKASRIKEMELTEKAEAERKRLEKEKAQAEAIRRVTLEEKYKADVKGDTEIKKLREDLELLKRRVKNGGPDMFKKTLSERMTIDDKIEDRKEQIHQSIFQAIP